MYCFQRWLSFFLNEASSVTGSELSWWERIANYRQKLDRSAFMSYEDGWAYGVWFLGNSWHVASGYYGGYPAGYLKRLRALFPDKQRALHLFSGKVDVAEFPGDTVTSTPNSTPRSSPMPTRWRVCRSRTTT
jgi:hypothetical protein